MTQHEIEILLRDVPDLARLEERGMSIDASTPTAFSMDDPWAGAVETAPPAPTQAPPVVADDAAAEV